MLYREIFEAIEPTVAQLTTAETGGDVSVPELRSNVFAMLDKWRKEGRTFTDDKIKGN